MMLNNNLLFQPFKNICLHPPVFNDYIGAFFLYVLFP